MMIMIYDVIYETRQMNKEMLGWIMESDNPMTRDKFRMTRSGEQQYFFFI